MKKAIEIDQHNSMRNFLLLFCLLFHFISSAQTTFDFKGQLSLTTTMGNKKQLFAGVRYLPQFSLKIPKDSSHFFDVEASANISGSTFLLPSDSMHLNGYIKPYRLWARYSGKHTEFRVGLQKIDFGSATLLRPLQWFNQIDPRDPLKLTNGVWGAMGRYYFQNNVNIWAWTLYGNEKPRGFDVVSSNNKVPEYGGRVQFPVTKGEMALSYHHRNASTKALPMLPFLNNIPENRIGIDGKWNLKMGLWGEAAYIHKGQDVSYLTNQILLNLGTDYTFSLGNGLGFMMEHLFMAFGPNSIPISIKTNVTALMLSYPLGLSDRISGFAFSTWENPELAFMMNYEHQFKFFSTYVLVFKNPAQVTGIATSNLSQQFAGPGVNFMLVYNH